MEDWNSYEEEWKKPMLFYSVEEYQTMRTVTFWAGCAVGAVCAYVSVFVSLWVAGAFVP